MTKVIKILAYVVACTAIVFILIKTYNSTFKPVNRANAFEWEKTVQVYFVDLRKAETSSCEADVPLSRTVLNAETLGPGAMEALLRGLDGQEAGKYWTSISMDTLLQKFEIKNGVAYVDFNSKLNEGVAGSCTVIAIRSQIEKTLIALPDIDSVVISVNGQTEGILEP